MENVKNGKWKNGKCYKTMNRKNTSFQITE